MLAAVQFPSWIHPEILPFLPGFPLRWYGLMYLVAFAVTYVLFRYQVRSRALGYSDDDISGFFLAGIIGLIVGARLFGTLLYDTSGDYWRKPWLIFWPFGEGGRFVGFMGMSFHGGFVGLLAGTVIYARKKRLDYLEWADMIAVSVPLGYTFGRLGNFINAELWGKVSAAPWAMVFPGAKRFPTSLSWVRDIAEKSGLSLEGAMINLPRHPSQLYEALFEGIVLWLVLWFVVRRHNPFKGFASAAYVFGYGFVRFFIEYFREPDADLGYILTLGDPNASIHLYTTPLNFSMGQLLCFLMMAGAAAFMAYRARAVRREASLLESARAERARLDSAKKRLRKR